ncbi:MAG TPA: methyltransferase domain-containing protein [Solirubrobacterales bacterium]|nr:methyltransferase domain-containing protein [Solirubrobacterales bacterium]
MNAVFERLKRIEDPIVRMSLLRTMGAAHWIRRGHGARRNALSRYLSSTDEPRLQFGAGPNGLPGWLNSDLTSGDIYLDLGRPLPLPDASFAYAFGEHVIEHISETAGEVLMAELYRVLKPGGVLRLTTPDLKKIIAIYEDRNPRIGRDEYMRFLGEITGKEVDRPCQALNAYLRSWGHRYVYDEEDLVAKLRKHGFDPVERREPGESPHLALRGVERHGDAAWINEAEAMCVEATRPSG